MGNKPTSVVLTDADMKLIGKLRSAILKATDMGATNSEILRKGLKALAREYSV